MKKILALSLIIPMFLLAVSPIFAQETEINKTPTIEEELEVEEITTAPSVIGLFFRNIGEQISLGFTFNEFKKAEKQLQYANRRIAEANFILKSEANEKLEVQAEKMLEKSNTDIDKINGRMKSLEEKDEILFDKFTELFAQKLEAQNDVLEKLKEKVSDDVYDKILESRNKRAKTLGEVYEKIEEKAQIKLQEHKDDENGLQENKEIQVELQEQIQLQEKNQQRIQDLEEDLEQEKEQLQEKLEKQEQVEDPEESDLYHVDSPKDPNQEDVKGPDSSTSGQNGNGSNKK